MRTPRPSGSELHRRRAVVAAWVAEHGYWCPGWGVPAHPARNLTADHVIPRFEGGERGPLVVRCMGCNTRRRYMPQHARRQAAG